MKFINKYNTVVIAAAASLAFTSCNDFLDELPDNRMELKNKDEVSSILVNAYPTQWSAYLLETFSDNTDEYEKPGWTAYDLYQEEAWSWGKITSIDDAFKEVDSNIKPVEIAKVEDFNQENIWQC
mgnify:CR=1 FL=1